MRRLAVIVASVVFSGIAVFGFAGAAEARVTNCWHHDYYNWAQGNCMGRDSNPPYTTQFALMLPCSNGTVTSGWKPAPYWTSAFVQCINGGRRIAAAYFLFK